jgi:hypothetical protein
VVDPDAGIASVGVAEGSPRTCERTLYWAITRESNRAGRRGSRRRGRGRLKCGEPRFLEAG